MVTSQENFHVDGAEAEVESFSNWENLRFRRYVVPKQIEVGRIQQKIVINWISTAFIYAYISFRGYYILIISKTLQWYIYLCIDFILLVLWIFACLQKIALLQKKMLEGFHSFPIVGWICYGFWICGFLHFFADICGFFAQIFARTSVASKQTIPVFSRARVAKRK